MTADEAFKQTVDTIMSEMDADTEKAIFDKFNDEIRKSIEDGIFVAQIHITKSTASFSTMKYLCTKFKNKFGFNVKLEYGLDRNYFVTIDWFKNDEA